MMLSKETSGDITTIGSHIVATRVAGEPNSPGPRALGPACEA
jgi:hypothetical protein